MDTKSELLSKPFNKYHRFFKKHGIEIIVVAKFLGVAYPTAANYLTSRTRLRPEIETKLESLVELVKANLKQELEADEHDKTEIRSLG